MIAEWHGVAHKTGFHRCFSFAAISLPDTCAILPDGKSYGAFVLQFAFTRKSEKLFAALRKKLMKSHPCHHCTCEGKS
jgi:hypothetical protein